jgi:hypothetical protein
MSETAEQDTAAEAPETLDVPDVPNVGPAPAPTPEGRCEAETTVGGTLYRCALESDHEDEHRWQPVEDEAPPPAPKATDLDKSRAQLANEAQRHYKRVLEITGEDAEALHPCELCSPLLAGWREDAAPAEATVQAVRVVIGLPDVSNFRASATERACDDCGGLGKVRTGSSVPGRETATCDACGGNGYVPSRPRQNTETAAAPAVENGSSDAPDYGDGVRRDMFGTPEGDPDFEKLPGARIRPTDYWQQNRAS